MKTTLPTLFLFLILTINAFSQANDYGCHLKNVVEIDSKNLQFDIWLEWTGTNTQKFCGFQGGVDFNYWGMLNGGVITGSFVAGSADPSLPLDQLTPNWNFNASSKQIRFIFAPATPSSVAREIPPPPGFRLGSFKLTNTVDFTPGSTPNFVWYFGTGSATMTTTGVFVYLNGATTGTPVTQIPFHYVDDNIILGLNDRTSLSQGINLSPNPGYNKIYLTHPKIEALAELNVKNITGQKEAVNYFTNSDINQTEIDISLLRPGIYFLEIINEKEKLVKKFIKE